MSALAATDPGCIRWFMLIYRRSLAAYVLMVSLALLACTGGDDPASATGSSDTSPPTPTSTPVVSPMVATATTTATPAAATPTTAAPRTPLDAPAYAAALCERAEHASTRSFDAFVAAADAFDGARGAAEIEAVAIAGWATESAAAWLEVAEWSQTVEPPASLDAYHGAIAAAAAMTTLERAALTDEIGAVADVDDFWILIQRGWAMFQLEPLSFIPGARDALATEPSFLRQDCGPLFESIGAQAALTSNTALAEYAAQTCWLHALVWDRQQFNLQDLALGLDPDVDLEETVLAGSIYARQEQRIQLMLGLGLQAIVPPPDAVSFHEAVFGNSADRLVAVFRSEVTLEDAIARDEVDLALNGLLNDAFALAEGLVAIHDLASSELQDALATSGPCGALDGSELAFYEALAG